VDARVLDNTKNPIKLKASRREKEPPCPQS
jgi:hypothetical protein